MKVLIAHTYYISRGGEDLVFETESKLLSKEGVDVATITFNNSSWKFLNFIFYPFNILSFFKMLVSIFQHKPDVVHIHNWHFAASPSIIVACKLAGIPSVQTLHNHRLISYLDVINKPAGELSKIFNHKKQKNKNLNLRTVIMHFQLGWLKLCSVIYKISGIWKLIDLYIVLTENSKKLYSKSHFNAITPKIVVKSNFIDGDNLQQKPKKDFLLYVGRLTREKGVHILLSAFENTDIKLKIIGDGPLKKEVEQISAQNSNIEYLGFQKFGFIKEIMAESQATIFPSITLEGMPMTIIESFACGTPVITTRYSAMENMITEGFNGLHFEVGNIKQLRDKSFQIFNMNEKERNIMSENARRSYEENYSPQINIKKLINIYNQLLQKK